MLLFISVHYDFMCLCVCVCARVCVQNSLSETRQFNALYITMMCIMIFM